MFLFYGDESFDGNPSLPTTITISGFLSDELSWAEVEDEWNAINRRYGVPCFHATALNHGKEEYAGWPKPQRDQYSAELLAVINRQGKRLVAYNCGMRADAYRRIINTEGQRKLGSPWFACFKSCVAMIAKHMETLPHSDVVSVVVERGSGFDLKAKEFFSRLAANPNFPHNFRLNTFASARPEQAVGLQLADMMAYEYFKQLHKRPPKMRVPLQRIRSTANYAEGFFGEDTFSRMKNDIENANCGTDELVIIPNL
jgi:hypothetical protein